MKSVSLLNLGLVPYPEALELQHQIVAARKRGQIPDTLILLEHPPVFTLGRNASDANVIASPDFLKQLGIETYRVERGGDVTYHGPNQLVGYPILDLRNYRQDVGWYVRSLETCLINALADFGIKGKVIAKLIGVWVASPRGMGDGPGARSESKIAQIGARIESWITYHGFALNVDPNMTHFDLIVPCGISDKGVTSMARVLQQPVKMSRVRERVAARFGEVFDVKLLEVSAEEVEAQLKESTPNPAVST
jgi:lipoyl(octanoyl) transferase